MQRPVAIITFLVPVPLQENGEWQTPEASKEFAEEIAVYMDRVCNQGLDFELDSAILKGAFGFSGGIDVSEVSSNLSVVKFNGEIV